MPSVLIVCEYATLSGGERSMLSTLGFLAAAGYSIRVAAPAAGPLAEALRTEGVKVVPFEMRDAKGVRLPLNTIRSNLADLLRNSRVDLLHANSLSAGRVSGPVAAEMSIPSLTHLRDIVSLSRQAVADLDCHRRLIAVSAATRDFHVAQGISKEKTFVVHNGVDLGRFCPRPPTGYLHRELGLAPEAPLIGTIGQISLRKGQDSLAVALLQVSEQVRFAWLIVGERLSAKQESWEFEDRLRQLAAGPLAGKMHFLGVRDDVDSILNELTLLVHPARQEPLGRVLLEAAAAGLAIIATDVGGTPEIFPAKSAAAVLVPPDDVAAMAVAITELLSDPARRTALGQSARWRAEEAFDQQRACEQLLRHYDELAGC
jgi:glycosyltransferase involved in cell wall biosynthesis